MLDRLLDDDVPDVYHSCGIDVVRVKRSFGGSPKRGHGQRQDATRISCSFGAGRPVAERVIYLLGKKEHTCMVITYYSLK